MNTRDLRFGWRAIRNKPIDMAALILSLALAYAVVYLMLGFVSWSFSFDRHVPEAKKVYVLKQRFNLASQPKWFEFMPLPFVEAARSSGMVAAATPVIKNPVQVLANNTLHRLMLRAVDPDFVEIFGVSAAYGDLKEVLRRPDEVALTMDAAQRIFGGENSFGKTLEIEKKLFKVAAILPNPRPATTIPYEALVGVNTAAMDATDRAGILSDWSNAYGKVYVKLKGAAKPEDLVALLQDRAQKSPFSRQVPATQLAKLGGANITDIQMVPLTEAYFDPDFAYNIASTNIDTRHGDKAAVLGMGAIATLILLLASVNYVNLATIRAMKRAREIGIRKLLGASGTRIATQFLAESAMVTVLAAVVGLLFARAAASTLFTILDRKIDGLFSPGAVLASLGLAAFVGILVGIYPAVVALRVRAVTVVAGRDGETLGGLWLRRTLTVVQFAVGMALVGMTIAVLAQVSFATNANPGFNLENLQVVELPNDLESPAESGFKDALSQLPEVKSVVATGKPIGFGANAQGSLVKPPGLPGASLVQRDVSLNFFNALGIRAVAGRLFDPQIDTEVGTNVAVINVTAARALGFTNPQTAVGQTVIQHVRGGSEVPLQVVGVAPDVREQSLREVTTPLLYRTSLHTRFLSVKTTGAAGADSAIKNAWVRYFPNDSLKLTAAKSLIEQNYADDARVLKILTISTALAFGFSSFGIYVLAMYSVQRKTREIALRKLHGAGQGSILFLVSREFLVLVCAGALMGLPVAALWTERYLADFSLRAEIQGWNLVFSFIAASIVAILAVATQTWTAMRVSPVVAMRA